MDSDGRQGRTYTAWRESEGRGRWGTVCLLLELNVSEKDSADEREVRTR